MPLSQFDKMWAFHLAVGVVLNIASAQWAGRRAHKELGKRVASALPDILHMTFPIIPFSSPDVFLFVSFAALIFSDVYENAAHMWALQTSVYVRAATMHLTLMPTCVPKASSASSGLYAKFFHSTHDLMFSGHTLCFLYIGGCLQAPFVSVCGPLMLVAARQHYTIDVCVAALVYHYAYMFYSIELGKNYILL